jgi:hypothetical protein
VSKSQYNEPHSPGAGRADARTLWLPSFYHLLTHPQAGALRHDRVIRENIFTPLGMKDSGYDSNSAVIPRRASGYVRGKDGFENAGFIHMAGAGAIRREAAFGGVAEEDDHAVPERLRMRSVNWRIILTIS